MLACSKAVAANTDMRATLTKVGVEGKKLIDREVRKDFGGDLAMSNWRRRRPVKLRSGFEQPADNTLAFNPKPAGLWQVAEQGRRSGSRTRRRRGGNRQTVTKTWGASKGKFTWTRSQRQLVDKTPTLYRKVQRQRVLDAFTKG